MSAASILVVEDEDIVADFISDVLSEAGLQVLRARDAEQGLRRLQQGREVAAVLLDRGLPGEDGLLLLGRIKADPDLRHLPVVMATARGDSESVRDGILAGAYYYLTKPLGRDTLLAVIRSALHHLQEAREVLAAASQSRAAMRLLRSGHFECSTLREARALAADLAHFSADPERVAPGLVELLTNAVEHGNLGFSYSEKSLLLQLGVWEEELAKREAGMRAAGQKVTVDVAVDGDTVVYTIRDQGAGFEWEDFLEFSVDRAFDLHGRGIAMARKLSFITLEYQGNGNTVVATAARRSPSGS